MKHRITLLLALCLSASAAAAATADEMMSQAYSQGRASGELTGQVADQIKSATRSKAATRGLAERLAIDKDGCYTVKFTVTQPDIPSVTGQLVGDFVTVTKFQMCPDSRQQSEPEVIECRVGATSCLPAKAPGGNAQPLAK